MEEQIKNAVQKALSELGAGAVNFVVEWPTEMSYGDYATNAALAAAKPLQKKPQEVAELLLPKLKEILGSALTSIEIAGPGFINFTLSPESVTKAMLEIEGQGNTWGNGNENNGKCIMIEYSNPNPFKELHIGHLMSNVVGESLSRLLEASGARVLRDTFGGDVGPHVAKALWSLERDKVTDIVSAKEIGKAYSHGAIAYEESKEAAKEIDELNTRIYEVVGKQNEPQTLSPEDRELLDLWRKGREISMEEFERLFKLLGTKFDYTFFDSDTVEGGMRVVRDGLEKGIFERSDGAIIYDGDKRAQTSENTIPEKGLHTLVFITSRGTPTYETKDIGLAFLKEERAETDEVIIVTAIEQIGHFRVFLAALAEIAPLLSKKTKHVSHGLLRLPTGKMSSRKGNVITAVELLEDMVKRASEKNTDPIVAEQVAIGAVKYMILRQSPGSDIVFDPEKSLSLEGDSGPYLQYALVRAKSVVTQSASGEGTDAPETPYFLERLLIRFPEVVKRSEHELAPNYLAHYLTQLASQWNSFYAQERIIGGDYEAYKLKLARAFILTMQNGLHLLGIPAPERM